MAELRLEGIEKIFPGGQAAVIGVDLRIASGELVVLLGPSGCGKSTLLRIIAGVETPTRGRVLVDDVDVTGLPPQKRDIAMVFQNYALYPHMTVRENLGFGLRLRGVERGEIDRRVREVAESLEIETLLERKPAQLSGGQRQRVALGRAIARDARVFLLDEPLSNLDAQLRVTTRAELARIHRSVRAPMVYVTHDQEEAMTLGDRVVVMAGGRVLQVGRPMEIYRRPATRFVGAFVGSPRMNFLPVRVGRVHDGWSIHGDGVNLELPWRPETPPPAGPASDRPAILGIRPEDLEIVPAGAGDLVARADLVEPLGRESLVHLVAEARDADAPVIMTAVTGPEFTAEPGAAVGLRISREAMHLFDGESEKRLD